MWRNLAIADLLNKPEDCCLWREQIGQYIDQADSAYQVFLLLNKPLYADISQIYSAVPLRKGLGTNLGERLDLE